LPGLPAIAQSGVPGYSYELWWGLFAPAGTPDNVVAALNKQVNEILASADMKKFLDGQGAQPWPLTTAQLKGLLVREIDRYKKAAKIAGIKPR
ncbi:MAG: tripartite tricarboxylate transporter substrate binding protein, partial [Betaproteobacteria bacterium]